jgi:hypothetical protein
MYNSTPVSNKFLYAICSITFVAPGVFFAYLTLKLLYVVLSAEDGDTYKTIQTVLAAAVFPMTSAGLLWMARLFWKKALMATD